MNVTGNISTGGNVTGVVRLGIGTPSPDRPLDVRGSIQQSSGNSNNIFLVDSDHDNYIIHQNSDRIYFMRDDNNNLNWDDGEEDRIVMYGTSAGLRL